MLENRIMWHHLDLLLPYKSVPCFPCKIIQLSGNCHHFLFMCCDLNYFLRVGVQSWTVVCVHMKNTMCFFVMQLHCAAEGCPRDKLWFSSKSWCRTQTWWVDLIHCCICFCTNCSQIELQQRWLKDKEVMFLLHRMQHWWAPVTTEAIFVFSSSSDLFFTKCYLTSSDFSWVLCALLSGLQQQ